MKPLEVYPVLCNTVVVWIGHGEAREPKETSSTSKPASVLGSLQPHQNASLGPSQGDRRVGCLSATGWHSEFTAAGCGLSRLNVRSDAPEQSSWLRLGAAETGEHP